MRRTGIWYGMVWLLYPVLAAAESPAKVDFNRDVRPILSDKCFKCHGPDRNTREADLRLDTREGIFAETKAGRVVSPGKADESELYKRIRSSDPEERMPPDKSGKELSAREIEVLRTWIEEGGEWNGHWAFLPVERPRLPVARSEAGNAIDRFIEAELSRQGLSRSPRANDRTLVRRMTLDLTGLPPRVEEVEEFVNDRSPERVERLVERLLASPRVGEHFATPWLDAARYADTSGYQNDGPREMWRWRDWVIGAINENKPFDEFSVEQLAGDLLPERSEAQVIATGFHRNHRGNSEGGIIPEEYAVEYVVDRVDTTGAVWLGLTIGCARCHEHKFDPVTQREYYGLFAYFNQVPELGRAIKEGNSPPVIAAPTEDQRELWRKLKEERDERRGSWQSLQGEVERAERVWERDWVKAAAGKEATVNGGVFPVVRGEIVRFALDGKAEGPAAISVSSGTARYGEGLRGGQALELSGEEFAIGGDFGRFAYREPFSISAWIRPRGVPSGGIVSRMSDDSDQDGWAVHLEEGKVQANFSKRWLDDSLRVETEESVVPDRWTHVVMTYDGSRRASGVKIFLDGAPARLKVNLDGLNQNFANDQPLRIGSTGTQKRFRGAIANVRVIAGRLTQEEVWLISTLKSVGEIAQTAEAERSRAEAHKLREYYLRRWAEPRVRETHVAWTEAEERLAALEASFPTTMVMAMAEEPRMTRLLKRGAYDQPGEEVAAGVPVALNPAGTTVGGTRLDLARWIVDRRNPLTARVMVNRLWQHFFGTGIVKTAEDFGTQGELPSHPELLDWLAREFIESGWDVKHVLRLIVTSETYQQSSSVNTAMVQRDPENRLLARGPRFRVSAEMVRDQALAVAGLLNEVIGGPSVKPYQPAGLWQEIATDTAYEHSQGGDLYRRTMYAYWKRTVVNPTLSVFDAPTREACQVRRSRTNTPLQALTLMNDVTFVEAARVLAARVLQEEGADDGVRIRGMFARCLGRAPSEAEFRVLREGVSRNRASFANDPGAVKKLLESGESPVPAGIDRGELAAFTVVASTIMNLDEFVTKE